MNCLVVDDDKITREIVSLHIEKTPFLNYVGACENAMEATTILLKKNVDLIFLDIKMPDMTGIEFLKTFKNKMPQVIFITSQLDHALEAFDLNVTDYLVKPITYNRFFQASTKALQLHNPQNKKNSGQDNESDTKSDSKSLFFRSKGKLIKLKFNEIKRVESHSDYLFIHTSKKSYKVHSTMKKLMSELPVEEFFRIHNSHIVRLDRIIEIQENQAKVDGILLPISRKVKKQLLNKLRLF